MTPQLGFGFGRGRRVRVITTHAQPEKLWMAKAHLRSETR